LGIISNGEEEHGLIWELSGRKLSEYIITLVETILTKGELLLTSFEYTTTAERMAMLDRRESDMDNYSGKYSLTEWSKKKPIPCW
jgi:hypothetical protein